MVAALKRRCGIAAVDVCVDAAPEGSAGPHDGDVTMTDLSKNLFLAGTGTHACPSS